MIFISCSEMGHFLMGMQTPGVKRWYRYPSVNVFQEQGQRECSRLSVLPAASRHPAGRQGMFAMRWLSSDALSKAMFHQVLWKVLSTFKLPNTYHREKHRRVLQACWYEYIPSTVNIKLFSSTFMSNDDKNTVALITKPITGSLPMELFGNCAETPLPPSVRACFCTGRLSMHGFQSRTQLSTNPAPHWLYWSDFVLSSHPHDVQVAFKAVEQQHKLQWAGFMQVHPQQRAWFANNCLRPFQDTRASSSSTGSNHQGHSLAGLS